jgi:hypothetical protein
MGSPHRRRDRHDGRGTRAALVSRSWRSRHATAKPWRTSSGSAPGMNRTCARGLGTRVPRTGTPCKPGDSESRPTRVRQCLRQLPCPLPLGGPEGQRSAEKPATDAATRRPPRLPLQDERQAPDPGPSNGVSCRSSTPSGRTRRSPADARSTSTSKPSTTARSSSQPPETLPLSRSRTRRFNLSCLGGARLGRNAQPPDQLAAPRRT